MADAFDVIRHAVSAAKVAAVRQRQAEIINGPPPSILHGQSLHRIGNGRFFHLFFRRDECLSGTFFIDSLTHVVNRE